MTRNLPAKFIRNSIQNLFGVCVNGPGTDDPQIYDTRLYRDLIFKGGLGFGEGYVNGFWDVQDLFAFKSKVYKNALAKNLTGYFSPISIGSFMRERLSNLSLLKARSCIGFHYDMGNQFYRELLGETMQYTSAYFPNSQATLNEAQEEKFRIVAKKLALFEGCSVLEIGCGWGRLARFLAEEHGCHVLAITLSKKQYEYCIEFNSKTRRGSTSFILADFRETEKYLQENTEKRFDRIVGIGTIAHFAAMFDKFVQVLYSNLKDGGLALIDDVCRDVTCRKFHPSQSPWISRYIFPGTRLFSADQIVRYFRNRFTIERWDSDRLQYRDTCLSWLNNFESRWETIQSLGNYDDRFFRIWKYYLTSAAAGFESGYLGQWQIVLSKMTSPFCPRP